jgi:hypothetical protein
MAELFTKVGAVKARGRLIDKIIFALQIELLNKYASQFQTYESTWERELKSNVFFKVLYS